MLYLYAQKFAIKIINKKTKILEVKMLIFDSIRNTFFYLSTKNGR